MLKSPLLALSLCLLTLSAHAGRRPKSTESSFKDATTTIQALPQGATAEVGFSPKRGSLQLVLKAISEAKQEILVA